MRKTIIVVVSLSVVLLMGYVGYRTYKVWKQTHMVALARGFIAKGDGRNALLSLQQAMRSNPKNIEVCRLMADLAEASRSSEALMLRSRVVELNPRSTEDRFALTRAALLMRNYMSATNALEGVDEAGRKTAEFHNLAGTVASAGNHITEAEAHFLEAVRLSPTNAALQLNLAVVRLAQTNATAQAQARASLQQLCANPTYKCQAFRELLGDAMRQKQTNAALALTKQLLQQTNSTFNDRLLRLDVLRAARDPEFKSALAGFQREAASAPEERSKAMIHELATWQMSKGSSGDALAWLKTLPRTYQTNQPVALLIAECQTSLKDWNALHAFLQPQSWGNLEFVRHAFQTRALRGQELTSAAKSEWESALRGAEGRYEPIVMLLRLAAQWNFQDEGEEILSTIVKRYPKEKWALQALTQTLFAGGRTRSLMMLYSQQAKTFPSDLGVKNNLAMTALLLDAQEMKPHELAREVFEKAPTNPSYASTYALSLYLLKKNADALKIIEQLGPKLLEDPSIAGYYGMILQAAGDGAKAKKYLDLVGDLALDPKAKPQFLPEEVTLFKSAKARANG